MVQYTYPYNNHYLYKYEHHWSLQITPLNNRCCVLRSLVLNAISLHYNLISKHHTVILGAESYLVRNNMGLLPRVADIRRVTDSLNISNTSVCFIHLHICIFFTHFLRFILDSEWNEERIYSFHSNFYSNCLTQ